MRRGTHTPWFYLCLMNKILPFSVVLLVVITAFISTSPLVARDIFVEDFGDYAADWPGDTANLTGSINAIDGVGRQGNIFGWYGNNFGVNQRITLHASQQSPWKGGDEGQAIAAVRNSGGTAIPSLFNYFTNRGGLPNAGEAAADVTGSLGYSLTEKGAGIAFDTMAESSLSGQPLFRFFDRSGEEVFKLNMRSDGALFINGEEVETGTFNANEWYRFEITHLDFSNATFDINILRWNEGNPLSVYAATEIPFMVPASELDSFRFSANSPSAHVHYLDNFKITSPRPGELPEVTSGVAIFVAPWGNDADPGTKESPKATLVGARNTIRTIKSTDGLPPGGVTVYLRGGVYQLSERVQFTSQDSGTAASPIIYRAYADERPRLNGAVTLDGNSFVPVSDPDVLARIPEEARDHVKVLDLTAMDIDYGQHPFRGHSQFYKPWLPSGPETPELIFNDELLTLARWPNEGFSTFPTVIEGGSQPRTGADPDDPDYQTPIIGFAGYEGERPSRWVTAPDAWVYGFWGNDWSDQSMQISSISPADRTLELAQASTYGVRNNHIFYAFNLLEELEQPGEWYLERETGQLYLYPPAYMATADILLSQITSELVFLNNVSHLTFQGLIFEAGRGRAFQINGGENNLVHGCIIRNFASVAIGINNGRYHGVKSCHVHSIGGTGITVGGGDSVTLTPSGHFVENNHLHNFARNNLAYRPAIRLSGVGQRVAHNEIHDAPHAGILYGGNNHLFEYNNIYDIAKITGDVGAFYSGRNWTTRGHVIRYNLMHSMPGRQGAHGVSPVYFDDGNSAAEAYGNVIHGTADRAVLIGGGHHIDVVNNLFIECDTPVGLDDRLLNWAAHHVPNLRSGLEGVVDRPAWLAAYPELADILTREPEPQVPHNNSIVNNLFYQSGNNRIASSALPYTEIEGNLETNNDPGFADPSRFDFSIPRDSWLFRQAPQIERIPFEHIGIYADDVNHARGLGAFAKNAPLDGGELSRDTAARLSWEPAANADHYLVRIATDKEMNELVAEWETEEAESGLPDLPEGSIYYWQVEARMDQPRWVEEGSLTAEDSVRSFTLTGFSRFNDSLQEESGTSISTWDVSINDTSALDRGWYVNAFDENRGAVITDDRASPWPGSGSNSIVLARFPGSTAHPNLAFHFSPVSMQQGGQTYEVGGYPGYPLTGSGYRIAWDFFTESYSTQPRWTVQDSSNTVGIHLQVRYDTRRLRYWDGSTYYHSDYEFTPASWYRFELLDVDVENRRWSLNVYRWDPAEQKGVAVIALRDKQLQHPVNDFERFVMQSWSASSDYRYFLDNFSLSQTSRVNLTYSQWRLKHFGLSEDGEPTADPDGIGIPNLLRFALAPDPSNPSRVRLPVARIQQEETGSYLEFTVHRDLAAMGLDWDVEVSSNLINWEAGGEALILLEDGPSRIRVREPLPQSPNANRFMRLRVRSADVD